MSTVLETRKTTTVLENLRDGDPVRVHWNCDPASESSRVMTIQGDRVGLSLGSAGRVYWFDLDRNRPSSQSNYGSFRDMCGRLVFISKA